MNKQHPEHAGQWFIFKGEQHRGPYQTEEMVNLFALGVIGHRDLVWREGGGTWMAFCDQAAFKELIFKEEQPEEELPPIEVPTSKPIESEFKVEMPPPPVPDEVELALEEEALPELPPDLPLEVETFVEEEQELVEESDKTSPALSFEDAIIEDDEDEDDQPTRSYARIVAGIFFVVTLVASLLWFTQFRLQTYDLIGLENSEVQNFNAVLIDHKSDHLVRLTKDSNVVWAAVPGVIEGEAYLKLSSVAGRVLATDPVAMTAQGEMVQGLVPFKKFEFSSGQQLIQGEYEYQVAVRPKGAVSRLASILAPYPLFNKISWVKNHTKGHTYTGRLSFYNGSKTKFDSDLEDFKSKIWVSMSKPLKNRLEKYETLKQLGLKLHELWHERLGVAVTWRAFKKYDAGYARDIAPVLQDLIVDSVRISRTYEEESPLVARLYKEIEETGKQVAELASTMSKDSKAVRRYRNSDKVRLKSQFESMWNPIIDKIENKIKALRVEFENLEQGYKSN